MEVWIETENPLSENTEATVTSHVEVWIETKNLILQL